MTVLESPVPSTTVLSREDFKKAMDELRACWKYQEDLNDFYRTHGADGYIFSPDCTETVLHLLHAVWGAADSTDMISYFVFDLDFGKGWAPGTVQDGYGNDIKLQTIDDLYDYLFYTAQRQAQAVEPD